MPERTAKTEQFNTMTSSKQRQTQSILNNPSMFTHQSIGANDSTFTPRIRNVTPFQNMTKHFLFPSFLSLFKAEF